MKREEAEKIVSDPFTSLAYSSALFSGWVSLLIFIPTTNNLLFGGSLLWKAIAFPGYFGAAAYIVAAQVK